MIELSFKHRLQRDFDNGMDTFLFRTIFLVGAVSQCIPKPFSKSRNKGLYWAIVIVAFALSVFTSILTAIQGLFGEAKGFARWLAKLEYRAEVCLKTHHFVLILIAALFVLCFAGFVPI